jgi:hypothetical protein
MTPGPMMSAAQINAEYIAECPHCHKPCEVVGHGRGKCSSCKSEFSLQQKLPVCTKCASECVTTLGNKHRCSNCGSIF